MVEARVDSNSRLCAQLGVSDARAFTESERAKVLELQLTEVRADRQARISVLEAEGKAEHTAHLSVLQAESKAKEAEHKARVAILEAENARLQLELARRHVETS